MQVALFFAKCLLPCKPGRQDRVTESIRAAAFLSTTISVFCVCFGSSQGGSDSGPLSEPWQPPSPAESRLRTCAAPGSSRFLSSVLPLLERHTIKPQCSGAGPGSSSECSVGSLHGCTPHHAPAGRTADILARGSAQPQHTFPHRPHVDRAVLSLAQSQDSHCWVTQSIEGTHRAPPQPGLLRLPR